MPVYCRCKDWSLERVVIKDEKSVIEYRSCKKCGARKYELGKNVLPKQVTVDHGWIETGIWRDEEVMVTKAQLLTTMDIQVVPHPGAGYKPVGSIQIVTIGATPYAVQGWRREEVKTKGGANVR